MRDYKKADADMLIQIAWQKYLSGVAASQDKGGLFRGHNGRNVL